jgi:hypothetical protein
VVIHQVKILTYKINTYISNSEKLQVWYLFMVHIASDDRRITEYLIGKDMQGSRDGLIWGNIFAFA